MKVIRLFSTLLGVMAFFPVNAQRAVVTIDEWKDPTHIYEIPVLADPFLAVSATMHFEGMMTFFPVMFFSNDGQNWYGRQALEPDPHALTEAPDYVSQLYFIDKNARYFRIVPAWPAHALLKVDLHFFNPGKTGGITPAVTPGERTYCPCPQPDFQGRLDWCPDGDCPYDPTPAPTDVTHLIVHHSAGVNTSSDWAAVVRSIWDFHVNTNGWDDIGYNWLIDPNGVLYEGRPDNWLGAHFCGQNGGTMGVCMLGTYTSVTPSDISKETLRNLLAWKSCQEDIDPLDFSFHNSSGLNLYHISGHRDGCNTECPGNAFYPELPDIRLAVADYIATSCNPIAPPTNLEAVAPDLVTVDLTWQDNADNETVYLVERKAQSGGGFEQIAQLGADADAYQDAEIIPGAYRYRVRAANDTDTSGYSNEVLINTDPSAVGESASRGDLTIFPNPASQEIRFQSGKPVLTIDLIGPDGRVYSGIPVTDNRLDITHLASGQWFVGWEDQLFPFVKN